MRRGVLNAYNLHKKTIWSKKCEKLRIITKFILSTKRAPKSLQLMYKLKKWELGRKYAVSMQTAVCRRGGGFKKVINLIGFNRHMARQNLNLKNIPVLKKMSW